MDGESIMGLLAMVILVAAVLAWSAWEDQEP